MLDVIYHTSPLGVLALAAIALLLWGGRAPHHRRAPAYAATAASAVSLALAAQIWVGHGGPLDLRVFSERLVIDNFGLFFGGLIAALTAGTALTSVDYIEREGLPAGEYYALLLLAASGGVVMAWSYDLLVLFMGLEILSVSVYVLVGLPRARQAANEAVLKYFLLGAFASAFFLYGLALLYGTTGSTSLATMQTALQGDLATTPLLLLGAALLLVGIAFKAGAVPFHAWAPDVYEGAALPVTGFMASVVKVAAFALFLRVFQVGLIEIKPFWVDLVWWIAVATMTIGNVMAFTQTNVKRLLAYSSIAHTGYLLIGVVALSADPSGTGARSVAIYSVAYALTTLGTFACLTHLTRAGERRQQVDDLAGTAQHHPLLAACAAVFMLSLIGLPPTVGFLGKFYLLRAAFAEGYTVLALIGLLNSLISGAYYLRIVVVMYAKNPTEPEGAGRALATAVVSVALAIMVLWTGMSTFPLLSFLPGAESLVGWADATARALQ